MGERIEAISHKEFHSIFQYKGRHVPRCVRNWKQHWWNPLFIRGSAWKPHHANRKRKFEKEKLSPTLCPAVAPRFWDQSRFQLQWSNMEESASLSSRHAVLKLIFLCNQNNLMSRLPFKLAGEFKLQQHS